MRPYSYMALSSISESSVGQMILNCAYLLHLLRAGRPYPYLGDDARIQHHVVRVYAVLSEKPLQVPRVVPSLHWVHDVIVERLDHWCAIMQKVYKSDVGDGDYSEVVDLLFNTVYHFDMQPSSQQLPSSREMVGLACAIQACTGVTHTLNN